MQGGGVVCAPAAVCPAMQFRLCHFVWNEKRPGRASERHFWRAAVTAILRCVDEAWASDVLGMRACEWGFGLSTDFRAQESYESPMRPILAAWQCVVLGWIYCLCTGSAAAAAAAGWRLILLLTIIIIRWNVLAVRVNALAAQTSNLPLMMMSRRISRLPAAAAAAAGEPAAAQQMSRMHNHELRLHCMSLPPLAPHARC